MGNTVKNLKIVVDADTKGAQSGIAKLNSAFSDLTGVSLTGAGALAALGAGLKYSIEQAMEAERVTAATEAVIKSTGGAAGLTAEQVGALALAESQLTSIDDEVIQSGQNMLLTFTNIGSDTFPRATRAMEDMAVAMAKGDTSAVDLNGTAVALGKALNDPIAGLSALSRVGVAFSATQEQQIKDFMAVGDAASAQAIILAELEKEFGGMAEAMGNTGAGKIKKAQNAIDNMAASIGEKLLPTLGDAAESLATLLNSVDKINQAYADQAKQVLYTADSYETYVAEMWRLARLRGSAALTGAQALTEAEFEEARAVKEAAQETETLAEATVFLGTSMRVPTDLINAQKLALEYHTQAAKDAKKADQDLALAKDAAAFVWQAANQAVQASNIDLGIQKALLDQIAIASGANTVEQIAQKAAIQELTLAVENGAISRQDFIDKMNGMATGALSAKDAVSGLGAAIDNLHSRDITITTRMVQEGIMPAQAAPEQWETDIAGGRALGGLVQAGHAYPVGDRPDRRPETFVPNQSGRVVPPGSGRPAGRVINATFNYQGQPLDEEAIMRALNKAAYLYG